MAWRVAAALLAVAAITGLVALFVAGGGAGDRATSRAPAPVIAASEISPPQLLEVPTRSGPTRRGPFGARLLRRVLLRASPGGRVVSALERATEFGSQQVLAVVAERQGWLAVLSQHMPNSRAGWIPATGAQLLFEPYTLHVDLSARALVVRRQGRSLRRITVAIGRPGRATPAGRFAVTDSLLIGSAGGPYGCCALALTGRQPNVAQGWSGGDRIAIHGTANEKTLGAPVSSGCLRASEVDMRWLIARIPLGTSVWIRA